MDFNTEVRKRQLRSLGQYVKSSKDSVDAIYGTFGWSAKKALKDNDRKIPCTVNKNHLISFKSKDSHIEKCKIQYLGYNLNDSFLSEPPENSSSTIKLDCTAKVNVLSKARDSNTTFKSAWNGHDPDPMTSDRLTSTFSGDERLALYDYCVKNTQGPPVPEEFTLLINFDKDGPKELTLEEQLMQERNARRRRTKYKSVHTNRKNQTEITREVIDNQMELYTEWLKEKETLSRAKLRENEKNSCENPFENLDNSQQYHFIQVHTTYGDVSIPANVLSEPLPSFNLEEEGEYVDKPPSPRSYSPQSSKRSTHASRSIADYKRRSKENGERKENEHTRKDRKPAREVGRQREQSPDRSKSRDRRRTTSRDRTVRERSKSRYRKEGSERVTRSSPPLEMSFRESSPGRISGDRNVEVSTCVDKPHGQKRRKSSSLPRQRSRSHSFEKHHRSQSKEFFQYRGQSRSPQRDRSPVFQENFNTESPPLFRKSPESRYHPGRTGNYYRYRNRRSMSLERETSPFYLEEEIFEDVREPYSRLERENRERDAFFPVRERRDYEMERKVSFRGRGIRSRFNNRRRSRGRPYFRH